MKLEADFRVVSFIKGIISIKISQNLQLNSEMIVNSVVVGSFPLSRK